VLVAIVDHITGVVVYPLIKPGQWAATSEVKLYIAPVQTGALEAESTVLAMTNRSARTGEIFCRPAPAEVPRVWTDHGVPHTVACRTAPMARPESSMTFWGWRVSKKTAEASPSIAVMTDGSPTIDVTRILNKRMVRRASAPAARVRTRLPSCDPDLSHRPLGRGSRGVRGRRRRRG
jgi:hypothetical protein